MSDKTFFISEELKGSVNPDSLFADVTKDDKHYLIFTSENVSHKIVSLQPVDDSVFIKFICNENSKRDILFNAKLHKIKFVEEEIILDEPIEFVFNKLDVNDEKKISFYTIVISKHVFWSAIKNDRY